MRERGLCLMKKILALIGCIILLVLTAAVFLLSIGTVFTAIPYIGSISNIITVGWLHLWLPLCVVLSLIGLRLCLANLKKPAHRVILALFNRLNRRLSVMIDQAVVLAWAPWRVAAGGC